MRSGEITLPFGGEDRLFRLRIGEVRAVEEKTGYGIGYIAFRLASLNAAVGLGQNIGQIIATGAIGPWKVDEVREVMLQGLIGGGMLPVEAKALVDRWVEPFPIEAAVLAYQVAVSWLAGGKEEPIDLGESKAGKPRSRSKTALRAGKASTAPQP